MSSSRSNITQSGPELSSPVREAVNPNADLSNVQPPVYSEEGTVAISHEGTRTRADITDDGRVDIVVDEKANRLSNLLAPALKQQLETSSRPPKDGAVPIPLNIVIQVVGSRGDVQPFVALGKVLKEQYHHNVRLATHPVFQEFVETNGLGFFSIGGDPAELMAFMVKNPSMMPSMNSESVGDISKRRKDMAAIMKGCWRSCLEPGNGLDSRPPGAISDNVDGNELVQPPYIADVIIANPPSFAHVHCAEKLGIPLHIMFTMPWSPTGSFPHPLANIRSSNAQSSTANVLSYSMIEMLTWQGLGDVVNRFREKTLGLEALSTMSATGLLSRLKIPQTYCWSPALIPKPPDWGAHISVPGFFFLESASSYEPDAELAAFLAAGSPPVYIGFGSIVVDDPKAMTQILFDAVVRTGQRALVSKGWGGLGEAENMPENIFLLGNCPHDWLFQRVSCVVHHGGAGTTAAGIAFGKPTIIVPFFGDQPFWGAMIAKAGAGPEPIPHKELTVDNLADAIHEALTPAVLGRAQELGRAVTKEEGCQMAVESFHAHLDMDRLRCDLRPSEKAVWKVKKSALKISATAATVLAHEDLLDMDQLRPIRTQEYRTAGGPVDPISGGMLAVLGSLSSIGLAITDLPRQVAKKALPSDNASEDRLSPSSSRKESQSSGQQPDQSSSRPSPSSSRKPSQTGEDAGVDAQSAGHARDPVTFDTAMDTGKGVSRIVGLGLRSPLDFTMGLSQGFRNVPRLYGDKTTREPGQVTGFHSGLKTAGKELGLGFYDGITGLVTQPVRGGRKGGFGGFIKGVGKGLGGVFFKPGAAVWGVPAYAFQGLYEEVLKYFGSGLSSYIVATRCLEGGKGAETISEPERREIIHRWLKSDRQAPRLPPRRGSAQQRQQASTNQDQAPPHSPPSAERTLPDDKPDSEEEMVRQAMALSLESERQREAEVERSRREEEIVMEYIRKASLEESQLKGKAASR